LTRETGQSKSTLNPSFEERRDISWENLGKKKTGKVHEAQKKKRKVTCRSKERWSDKIKMCLAYQPGIFIATLISRQTKVTQRATAPAASTITVTVMVITITMTKNVDRALNSSTDFLLLLRN